LASWAGLHFKDNPASRILVQIRSTLEKQPFLNLSFPLKILAAFIRFSLFWISQQYFFFYRTRSLALRPTPNLEEQVLVFMSPQWQGGAVMSPDTGFPFRPLLRLAGLRWRYSNSPEHISHL
jgi:hypothetical protein